VGVTPLAALADSHKLISFIPYFEKFKGNDDNRPYNFTLITNLSEDSTEIVAGCGRPAMTRSIFTTWGYNGP